MAKIGRIGNIISKNNLTLCHADYFETCWCHLNSTTPIKCPYLLRHVQSYSNSSYFCVYHVIRKSIECFNSLNSIPKQQSVSNIYIYLTTILFIIGLIGNGISVIILLSTKLRHLCVYKNLTILCILNILYLISILIRHKNIYEQDLRYISNEFCRLHTFIVAFIGHLCSWQLVSTSIQRVYVLLSLQSHRTTSWVRIWTIFFICLIIPLLLFDGQLFFHYGLLKENHICNTIPSNHTQQYRRALQYPMDMSKISNNISLQYHTESIPEQSSKISKEYICLIWNIIDTFIYSIIPFLIILISSFIIIVKVCQRRRSTVILGGICHRNRVFIASPRDHLSTLLITTNILFFLMTGPLNISLTIQSIFTCFYLSSPSSTQLFLYINEYLRLLQNSYHALSFIFYCVIGNKFRNSAKSICRKIYYQFLEYGISDRCAQTPLISCCLDRRRSSSSGQTLSTNTRSSDTRRLTNEQLQQRNNSIQMHVIRRTTQVTFNINQRITVHSL